ncbi:MAG TPA: 7-cyano-7-deazaguanine synthase [Kribbellaceae bacterium]|nr:7-cyano-7-deazaguanine synthase [Kribbellaceae bacterium]
MVADFRVVFNDCAAPPMTRLTHLYTRPGGHQPPNVNYVYQRTVEGLPAQLTPAQQDWLDILGALYATDLACQRGANADWARAITVWIGVREPDHWQPLAARFSRLFAALTFDHIEIHFEHDRNPIEPPRQRRKPINGADCVALISGGVDSLTGAGMLLNGSHVPLFLSHQNSGAVGKALGAVDHGLKPLGSSAGRVSLTARLQDPLRAESTQRSRSMLYMGVACLLATCLGLRDVYLNENGVMAIHAPLTAARLGSYSTRTANPNITRDFARLASAALGCDLAIRNLLVTLTKPDVVDAALRLGLNQVLPHSVSCWAIGRHPVHCGYCIPCLVRRIAFQHSDASDGTYETNPLDDIPPGAPWAATAKPNLVDLAAQAIDMCELDDAALEYEYPELLNCGDQLTRDDSFAMHRRWASQCLAVMRTYRHAAALAGL